MLQLLEGRGGLVDIEAIPLDFGFCSSRCLMLVEAHLEIELEQSLHPQLFHQRRLPSEKRANLYERTLGSVNFLVFLDDLDALVVLGGHILVFVDPRPPK